MMYNCNNHKTIFSHNKGVPVANSIHHSNSIYNYFKSLKLGCSVIDIISSNETCKKSYICKVYRVKEFI